MVSAALNYSNTYILNWMGKCHETHDHVLSLHIPL